MGERKIYEITGADRLQFLQGLISNDVRKLENGPLYAALLTPQGKYLADFLLVPKGDTILLDIDAGIAEATVRRLSMYKLRSDVAITASELHVFRGTGPKPEEAVSDPRDPALGWRLYGAASGDDGTDWDAIRVAHCIPETGIELTPDSYILESGFERLHGVDFRKGCYVGQEVTARMKHKTDLRKGLITVAVGGEAPVGTEIFARDADGTERLAGQLFTQSGGRGIAYLRFDRMDAALHAGEAHIRVL